MQTDAQFYEQDDKVLISQHLLDELITAAGNFPMMYADWVAGITPDTHPDIDAVNYLIGETNRIRTHARRVLQAPTPAGEEE